ncbi:hypothetical protein, partial [Brasilonema sp. UFV-L1]|uniref:hypothetical protein n=1 Tax=Brasilonema sp. UFV-L1 TaxID=2234130 RepID=UPI001B7CEFCD
PSPLGRGVDTQLCTSLHPGMPLMTTTPKLLLDELFPLFVHSSRGCTEWITVLSDNFSVTAPPVFLHLRKYHHSSWVLLCCCETDVRFNSVFYLFVCFHLAVLSAREAFELQLLS